MSSLTNPTFKAQMCCFNCGLLDHYDVPVRREIIGYEHFYAGIPGQEPLETVILSRTQRRNGTDIQPLICNRCQMPYLQPAFYVAPVANIIPIQPGGQNG